MKALVIMAKAPVPKKVKTRLILPLGSLTASDLYYNFLLDRIEQIKVLSNIHRFFAYTPKKAQDFFKQIVPQEIELLPQTGRSLGERLYSLTKVLLRRGFKKVVLVDSDSPNLPSNYIIKAFDRLDKTDLTLGPSEDGGYYLIGVKSDTPGIFKHVPWSTPRVAELTVRKALKLGLTVSILETWYDVDTYQDLLRLKNDLRSRPLIGYFCRNTYRALSNIKRAPNFSRGSTD